MVKISKIYALLMLITAFNAHAKLDQNTQYATVNDLKAALKSNEYARSGELARAMHQLHNRNLNYSYQQEYLINTYHRLTEELNALARKLKEAKKQNLSEQEIAAAQAAWNLKNSEILSLKKSYQREVGTTDIASDAAPVLEALEKLQAQKQ